MAKPAAPEAMETEKAVIDDTTVDGAPVEHAATEAMAAQKRMPCLPR